jgi:hypothetical protein
MAIFYKTVFVFFQQYKQHQSLKLHPLPCPSIACIILSFILLTIGHVIYLDRSVFHLLNDIIFHLTDDHF